MCCAFSQNRDISSALDRARDVLLRFFSWIAISAAINLSMPIVGRLVGYDNAPVYEAPPLAACGAVLVDAVAKGLARGQRVSRAVWRGQFSTR